MAKNFLFEVSWEVCNKVGGIYTVIASKMPEALKAFNGRYAAVGPLLPRNPGFIPEDAPEFASAIAHLAARRIEARTGRWDIPGSPRAILVGFQNAFPEPDKLLYQLWNEFGVDSMSGAWDYVEPVLFSTAAAMVIEEFSEALGEGADVCAHFHEWMSGAGVLRLKGNAPSISTVLTTHATMLGRAMSGSGVDIYARLEQIEPFKEARNFGVIAKHSMETVSAREADCFATVSNITRDEATHLLGKKPDAVTPNGFDLESFPNYVKDTAKAAEARARMIDFASRFLNRELDPARTCLLATSGRYEFHNKGIDVLIESLGAVSRKLAAHDAPDVTLVTFFLVTGGYAGYSDEARRMKQGGYGEVERYATISTHHLGNQDGDPIVRACRDQNLQNAADSKCCVIFIPVYLDGNDGVLNLDYYDALAGCDITAFPSFYEPWGYTPLESVAYGVPTVTSDRAGFGQWVMEQFPDGHLGVDIVRRIGDDDRTAADQLTGHVWRFLQAGPEQRARLRKGARSIAEAADWKKFFPRYTTAYDTARRNRGERISGVQRLDTGADRLVSFTGVNTTQPRLRQLSVVTELPPELARLREVADNLWWVWNAEAQAIFEAVSPSRWRESGRNPAQMLSFVPRETLDRLLDDKPFMDRYRALLARFDAYMAARENARVSGITWEHPVAYFSMEFGLHESIPIYSGGLGLLAGDHIKSASDMNLPFVGVSLLYKHGYFRQRIDGEGKQAVEFVESNFASLPMNVVVGENDERILVTVDLPGRTVYAQIWEIRVGRARLCLLDTDLVENSRSDRDITARLYEPSSKGRIEQEILLGIGGVRMLAALGIAPCLYHLNEGHSAFLLFERIRLHMHLDSVDLDTAKELVRAATVFTMHTPVPAGNERFDKSLVENYFRPYAQEMGVPFDELWNMGHIYSEDAAVLNMTVLALRLSSASNGVSKLHGHVSRTMWQDLWRGFLLDELPIGHVTNGVHIQSWMDPAVRAMVEENCRLDVSEELLKGTHWECLDGVDDTRLWRTHVALKERLYEEIRENISRQWTREGEAPNRLTRFLATLNPSALTLCFARRFTGYKRPTLIFQNVQRIKEILFNAERPVNLIFAGKAHPADTLGAEFIHLITRLSRQDDCIGRVAFLENYDIRLARLLVSGADVWLNNPIRLMEASGTSGMKAAANGVPNLSILDGWWDEGYDGRNGWAIGAGEVYDNQVNQDLVDAENLYLTLAGDVVPEFWERDNEGVPRRWVARMRAAMRTALADYSTHRMLRDYIGTMYEPTISQRASRLGKDIPLARDIGEWRKRVPGRFSTVTIREVRVVGARGDEVRLGNAIKVTATVDAGQMSPGELEVELVTVAGDDGGPIESAPMTVRHREGNVLQLSTTFTPSIPGPCRYGVRVLPVHPALGNKYEARLVKWS